MLPISFNRGWEYFKDTGNRMFGPRATKIVKTPVVLPHDATIHEDRTKDAASGASKGYYPNGAYVYEKKFTAPLEWADKRVWLTFEGVYMRSRVFLNGDYAGQCANGYSEYSVKLNDSLRYGEENELSVSLVSDIDSRWYAGAGIYRNVSLYVADMFHIAQNGVRLTTAQADGVVASVVADVTIENESLSPRGGCFEITLVGADGEIACRDVQTLNMTASSTETFRARLYVKNPRLWSPDEPNLYKVTVRLIENDSVTDEAVVETFGIRTLALDTVRGFTVNGKTYKLYGGCIHHDNGLIGAATIEKAEERRVKQLKSAGYNAIRSAHHPMSRGLLKACDKYGVMVMDELTDMWSKSKTLRDYGNEFDSRWEADVTAMVTKDYNHPCVVMYSMGNEIPESGSKAGAKIYRKLSALTRSLDHTRYITAGLNNMIAGVDLSKLLGGEKKPEGELNSVMSDMGARMQKLSCLPEIVAATHESYESMDICGYNYATDRYINDYNLFTNWISVGAETFPKDLAYNWKVVTQNVHAIGDFTWTSYDYLGEAGIGRDKYLHGGETKFAGEYPWRIAWDADFDITGVRTAQSYYREIVVGHRTTPYIAVQEPSTYEKQAFATAWSWTGTLGSWNWRGYEGKHVYIDVYGKGDEAELLINGKSAGKKPIPRESVGLDIAFRTIFDVVYDPGEIEAVIYTNGAETGRFKLETADDDIAMRVSVEGETIENNDFDLAFVNIDFVDGNGRLSTDLDRIVRVKVEGAGYLQGFGSGDPCCEGKFDAGSYKSFYGHSMAVIRPKETGIINVIIEAEGLPAAFAVINVK